MREHYRSVHHSVVNDLTEGRWRGEGEGGGREAGEGEMEEGRG